MLDDVAFIPDQKAPRGRAQWLAAILRERLWNGAYRPGQWIREHALRAEFGFSNGPVREALQALVAEGLLERVPYSGIRVASLTDTQIVELFQLRLALLELAAELAARRCDPAALAKAEGVIAEARRNWTDGTRPFTGHLMQWLVDAAGNAALAQSWAKLAGQSRMYVYEAVRRSADPAQFAERLIDRVVAGDAAGAREAVRRLTRQQVEDLGLVLAL
jgi:DNA-binding GntR family transcriptional regulator